MLLHYADLAERNGVAMLVVGTEMQTLSSDDARWRALIAEVREHFHGQLTYAANYDEFTQVRFWDALDFIGIDAYFSLADASDPTPSVDALASSWTDRGYLARIAAVSRITGKQVLFTEVGYRGIRSTAVQPNRWDVDDETDVQAQANAYAAFYQAVADQPWMAGVYWWGVDSDSWWVNDFSPLGKPAEQVMSAWNKRGPATPSPTMETPPVTQPVKDDPPPAPPVSPPRPPPVTETTPPRPADRQASAIRITVRPRRLAGVVAPYTRSCRGTVKLQLRRRSHDRWLSVRTPRPLALTTRGAFSSGLRPGHVRVRAVFSSRCGAASSPWVSANV
jgi:hypothetical protein